MGIKNGVAIIEPDHIIGHRHDLGFALEFAHNSFCYEMFSRNPFVMIFLQTAKIAQTTDLK